MYSSEPTAKSKTFKIFVVRSIDDKVEEVYTTGVRDFVFVPIKEAKRTIEKNGHGYYMATDDKGVAEQYGIKLIYTINDI